MKTKEAPNFNTGMAATAAGCSSVELFKFNSINAVIYQEFEGNSEQFQTAEEVTLFVIFSGSVLFLLKDKSVIAGEGNIVAIAPGETYSFCKLGQGIERPQMMQVTFNKAFLLNNASLQAAENITRKPLPVHHPKDVAYCECPYLVGLLKNISLLCSVPDLGDKEKLVDLSMTALLLRVNSSSLANVFRAAIVESTLDTAFARVLNYIDERITEQISINELCHFTLTSKSVLFRKFKSAFNTTPVDFILRKKVELASKLLLNSPHTPIKKICTDCGFNSESYFAAIFKRYYKVTPQVYRKTFFKG